MSLVDELAERAHAMARDEVPDAVRAQMRAHVADAVGSLVAGHTTLHATMDRPPRGGEPPQGGAGVDAARRVAFTGGVYAHCWEVGAFHRASVVCPGCVVLPAVLAVLHLRGGASWDEVLRACLAGYEVAVAAAVAVRGDLLIEAGWWPTALVAPLGAAAAASVLLGHTAGRTASAVALAAQQAGGSVAGRTTDADGRYLLSGYAAERALTAALAADAGWRGPRDFLDDVRSPLGRDPAAKIPEHHLLPEVSMKAHAGAKHVMAAIDAVLHARSTGDGTRVRRIVCRLPARLAPVVDRPPPFCSPLSALASAQFTLAVAALRGHCTPWDFTADTLADPAVLALARNVTVVPDLDVGGDPAGWGASAEVTTASGTVLVERESAKGDPGNELTRAELTEKFETLAGRSLGRATARELAGTLLSSGGDAPTAALDSYVLPLLRGHLVGLGGGR